MTPAITRYINYLFNIIKKKIYIHKRKDILNVSCKQWTIFLLIHSITSIFAFKTFQEQFI